MASKIVLTFSIYGTRPLAQCQSTQGPEPVLIKIAMAKRFTDTDIFMKKFIRSLGPEMKLFWIYLYHSCNHAGIWEVDFRLAEFILGVTIDDEQAGRIFSSKVVSIDNGNKWFIPGFISFQYGELNPDNRAHNSVIKILKKYCLFEEKEGAYKPLVSPLEGAMDMDTYKVKDLEKEKSPEISKNPVPEKLPPNRFEDFWNAYPNKVHRPDAERAWVDRLKADPDLDIDQLLLKVARYRVWVAGKNDMTVMNPGNWLRNKRDADDLPKAKIETAEADAEKERQKNMRNFYGIGKEKDLDF